LVQIFRLVSLTSRGCFALSYVSVLILKQAKYHKPFLLTSVHFFVKIEDKYWGHTLHRKLQQVTACNDNPFTFMVKVRLHHTRMHY